MNLNINDMEAKVLLMTDPNSGYTQADFNNEFGETTQSNKDSFKIKFSFTNKSTNEDPSYATDGSSGFDLRADLTRPIKLNVGKTTIIPTGLFFNIPPNFEIQIRSRSGLAANNQVIVLNSPGTIDADYRGEIKVILTNLGDEDFVIQKGDRIAQAVIASVLSKNIIQLNKVDDISNDTERGSGGFGSTGLS